MKLLIVDDEADALEGMELYFASKGHEVFTARGGHEALALVKACKPTVMLLDLKMKGLSGFEIMERINQMGTRIATIVITGMSQDNLEEECRRLGALRVVSKPVKMEDLERMIGEVSNGDPL